MKALQVVSVGALLFASWSAYGILRLVEADEMSMSPSAVALEWKAATPPCALRNGDLVFRHARGTISNMLVHFSRQDPRYSHAGIVALEAEGIVVYHAIGGEGSRHPGIRREPLSVFCSPATVHRFGLYRLEVPPERLTAVVEAAKASYTQNIPFDSDFDLSTDTAVYCTEFIYRILRQEGCANASATTAFKGIQYVACDNLYLQPHVHNLYSYTYAN